MTAAVAKRTGSPVPRRYRPAATTCTIRGSPLSLEERGCDTKSTPRKAARAVSVVQLYAEVHGVTEAEARIKLDEIAADRARYGGAE